MTTLLRVKQREAKENETPVEIEMMWVPGGRDGTRAWRVVPVDEIIKLGERYGKVKRAFDLYKRTCKHRLLCDPDNQYFICGSKENKDEEKKCSSTACPMIIRK